MARTLFDNCRVGQFVYKAYSPQAAGVIVELLGPEMVKIRWLNGEVTEHGTLGLRDFHALLNETAKKLDTHTRLLSKLTQLNKEG